MAGEFRRRLALCQSGLQGLEAPIRSLENGRGGDTLVPRQPEGLTGLASRVNIAGHLQRDVPQAARAPT